jgi:hypothetical protein
LKWRDPTLQWVALQTASKFWVLRASDITKAFIGATIAFFALRRLCRDIGH